MTRMPPVHSERLLVMRHTLRLDEGSSLPSTSSSRGSTLTASKGSVSKKSISGTSLDIDGPRIDKLMRRSTKLKMGDNKDDIHVCIMCLRAIMNNKFGFNMVIQHSR